MKTVAHKTIAELFISKAAELMPEHDELRAIDPSINSKDTIDEIIFRHSEYLGGMAQVILRLI